MRRTILIILIIAVITAVRCGPSRPVSREYFYPKSKYNSWDQVFANPSKIKIISLKTSTMKAHWAGVINLNNPRAASRKEGTLTLPVYIHLLRHEKYGDCLIDAGIPASEAIPEEMEENSANLNGAAPRDTSPEWGTGPRLKAMKARLKAVFFTHLHGDHSIGIVDLPGDIMFAYGNDEKYEKFNLLNSREYVKKYLQGIKTVYSINCANAQAMPPFGPCADLLGDGSLWAIPTPGHSAGHLSFLVNCADGPVLFTGDACVIRWGFEHEVEPGFYSSDIETSKRSLALLRDFSKKYPKIRVAFGHEL